MPPAYDTEQRVAHLESETMTTHQIPDAPAKGGHDIPKLQKRVSDLSDALARLYTPEDWQRLIPIFRRPGWTTPAEFVLVSGIVESMLAHTAALTKLKGQLIRGSEMVGTQ